MKFIRSTIRTLLLSTACCCLLWMCTKDQKPPTGADNMVTVLTNAVTGITADSALTGGEIKIDRWDSILERGVCWGLVDTPLATGPDRTDQGKGRGSFVSRIKPLKPNTFYYVRAYAKSIQGYIYGNVRSFKTPSRPPTVLTEPASGVTQQSATLSGNVTSDGGSTVTQRGFYWSLSNPNPTQIDNVLTAGNGTGSFVATLTGLSGGRIYYFRAWASNSFGTTLASNVISFTTAPAKIPILGTTTVSSVTRNTAYVASNITSNEGATVNEYGFCWSTSPNPTYLLPTRMSVMGSMLGAFNSTISGLSAGTTYYLRAYAINAAGPGYSPQQVFTTSPVVLPTVMTNGSSSVSSNGAILSGFVSNDGGGNVFERGFYYSSTGNPGPSSPFIVSSGTGTGGFSAVLTGLTPNTTYNFTAYAKNAAGTAMSSSIFSFRTLAPNPPTVTTVAASNITTNSFQSGGIVTADGGSPIVMRGVCWNTSGSPTTANSLTNNGSGLGSFTSVAGSLTSNTTYYVRAYAVNSGGIVGYGNQIIVQTPLPAPSLVSPLNNITLQCCNQWFSWSAVPGATSYEFQLSKSSSFSFTISTLAVCGSGSMNSSTVNRALTSSNNFCVGMGTSSNIGNWYWRVRAVAGSNVSAWSAVRQFYYPF